MIQTIKDTLLHNPARKWLYVSFLGFTMCFTALGMHVSGAGNTAQPLPSKVLSQVFGFSPYYFQKDSPPDKLTLKSGSPKFLGNALSYELVKSANESITVSEKTAPTGTSSLKTEGDISFETTIGNGLIGKPKDGRIKGSLLTRDKTLISLEAPESVNPDLVEAVLRAFAPTIKPDLTKP